MDEPYSPCRGILELEGSDQSVPHFHDVVLPWPFPFLGSSQARHFHPSNSEETSITTVVTGTGLAKRGSHNPAETTSCPPSALTDAPSSALAHSGPRLDAASLDRSRCKEQDVISSPPRAVGGPKSLIGRCSPAYSMNHLGFPLDHEPRFGFISQSSPRGYAERREGTLLEESQRIYLVRPRGRHAPLIHPTSSGSW